MNTWEPDSGRAIRLAAWIWVAYLGCLLGLDLIIYAGKPGLPILIYHLIHALPAAVFLVLANARAVIRPARLTTLLMILILSAAPILAPNVLDPKLPPAPLSNLEGMVLRQLPVLMIALILVAWHYSIEVMVLYSAAISLSEYGVVVALNRLDSERLSAFGFIVLVRLACFIVTGIFVNQLIASLHAQRASLEAANRQLANYASTLEKLTVSRERNRMSRELHDTVVHTLSGLSVQLETTRAYLDVNLDTSRQLLDQSLSATRSGLQETRRALKALRASPLDDLGLLLAMRQLAESASERGKLELALSLPDQAPALRPEAEQCLYRVAQEAIGNVVDHANAHRMAVKLTIQAQTAELMVHDDGIGFDPQAERPPGHYGIRGMEERAALLGGMLTVASQPGKGTTVRLVLRGE